ncbi:MAG: hypothetical protein KatS3mg088_271 [Patescibacteria group bacterium]|nr:MAG: hypothetical protein KatS3mg088_271 [Patescibacteria group bacterium]
MKDSEIVVSIKIDKDPFWIFDFIFKAIVITRYLWGVFRKNYNHFKPDIKNILFVEVVIKKIYRILIYFIFAFFLISYLDFKNFISEEKFFFVWAAFGSLFFAFYFLTTIYIAFYLIILFFLWIRAVLKSLVHFIKDIFTPPDEEEEKTLK